MISIWKRVTLAWGNEQAAQDGSDTWSLEVLVRPSLAILQKTISVAALDFSEDDTAVDQMKEVFLLIARKPKNLSIDLGCEGVREIDNLEDFTDYIDLDLLNELYTVIEKCRRKPTEKTLPPSLGGGTSMPADEVAVPVSKSQELLAAPECGTSLEEKTE